MAKWPRCTVSVDGVRPGGSGPTCRARGEGCTSGGVRPGHGGRPPATGLPNDRPASTAQCRHALIGASRSGVVTHRTKGAVCDSKTAVPYITPIFSLCVYIEYTWHAGHILRVSISLYKGGGGYLVGSYFDITLLYAIFRCAISNSKTQPFVCDTISHTTHWDVPNNSASHLGVLVSPLSDRQG